MKFQNFLTDGTFIFDRSKLHEKISKNDIQNRGQGLPLKKIEVHKIYELKIIYVIGIYEPLVLFNVPTNIIKNI